MSILEYNSSSAHNFKAAVSQWGKKAQRYEMELTHPLPVNAAV